MGTSSGRTSSSPPTRSGAIGSEPLIVLNDTYTLNLAHDTAAAFTRGGWTVSSYNEGFYNQIAQSTVYYDPSVSGAKAAAQALQRQFPGLKRVVPRFAGADAGQDPLPAGPVVVVLTAGYTAG